MLNFQNNILLFSLLTACWTTEPPPSLPETQLGKYNPIVRKFQYNQLQAWIVKPSNVEQNKLFLASEIHPKDIGCLDLIASKEPRTLFILAKMEQQDLAKKYISGLNDFSTDTLDLSCQ